MEKKEEILRGLRDLAAQHLVTRDEVLAAFDAGPRIDTEIVATRQTSISNILYYVGGAIVFLGISVLIWQHWVELNSATKILATLGSGISAYIIGVLLSRDEHLEATSRAFYFISALATPLGLYVTFDSAGLDAGSHAIQSLISGILLTTFLLSHLASRKVLFTLFSIIFGTWFFFSFTNYLVGSNPHFDWRFSAYRVLFTGLMYFFLGLSFAETHQRKLTSALYGFGAFLFLGAALALGEWEPHQNVLWELAFPGLAFGVMFLSVLLKSKGLLTFGSIYLMGYILKITAEYFTEGLGWPLALVLAGLVLIAIGYLHLNLNKKFLA